MVVVVLRMMVMVTAMVVGITLNCQPQNCQLVANPEVVLMVVMMLRMIVIVVLMMMMVVLMTITLMKNSP